MSDTQNEGKTGNSTLEDYKTIDGRATGEIIEKKSRFITQLAHVDSEEAALSFIEDIKHEHAQARHNVYAYILRGGRARYSDDGEPAQTAGLPTYEVLAHANLVDIACVTTRYFGGVLLGTGGLVRAYTASVQAALDAAKILEVCACRDVECIIDYSQFEILQRVGAAANATAIATEYTDKVKLTFRMKESDVEGFETAVREATSGKCTPIIGAPKHAAM